MICIISSSPKVKESMKSVLETFDIEISSIQLFSNFNEAKEWISLNLDLVKVIIVDYDLEGESGIYFLESLNYFGFFERIEVLLCNNSFQAEVAERSIANPPVTIIFPYRPNKFVQKLFEKADQDKENSALIYCEKLIRSKFNQRNFNQVIKMVSQMVKTNGEQACFSYYLGEAYRKKNLLEKAKGFYYQGLKLKKNNLFCLKGLKKIFTVEKEESKLFEVVFKICSFYPLSKELVKEYLTLVLKFEDFKEASILERISRFQKKIGSSRFKTTKPSIVDASNGKSFDLLKAEFTNYLTVVKDKEKDNELGKEERIDFAEEISDSITVKRTPKFDLFLSQSKYYIFVFPIEEIRNFKTLLSKRKQIKGNYNIDHLVQNITPLDEDRCYFVIQKNKGVSLDRCLTFLRDENSSYNMLRLKRMKKILIELNAYLLQLFGEEVYNNLDLNKIWNIGIDKDKLSELKLSEDEFFNSKITSLIVFNSPVLFDCLNDDFWEMDPASYRSTSSR